MNKQKIFKTDGKYILKDKKVVEVFDLHEWADWMEKAQRNKDRIVKQDHVGKFFISTVFLGLDYNHLFSGPPQIFETMVFDESRKQKLIIGDHEMESMGEEMEQLRYSTYNQALRSHNRIVKKYVKITSGN